MMFINQTVISIIKIYRKAKIILILNHSNPQKQILFLEHCTTLDAVFVSMLQEPKPTGSKMPPNG